MDHRASKKSINPLASIMRQPKIYISLPSKGQYWPPDSLKVSDNQEYPVYSMTAKDELLLKTPDALLNGQAVVDVLESCVPNIVNAWDCPQIDLDALLIAIRIALGVFWVFAICYIVLGNINYIYCCGDA